MLLSNLKTTYSIVKQKILLGALLLRTMPAFAKQSNPEMPAPLKHLAIQAFSGRQVSCRPSRRAVGLNLCVSLNLAYHQASIPVCGINTASQQEASSKQLGKAAQATLRFYQGQKQPLLSANEPVESISPPPRSSPDVAG